MKNAHFLNDIEKVTLKIKIRPKASPWCNKHSKFLGEVISKKKVSKKDEILPTSLSHSKKVLYAAYILYFNLWSEHVFLKFTHSVFWGCDLTFPCICKVTVYFNFAQYCLRKCWKVSVHLKFYSRRYCAQYHIQLVQKYMSWRRCRLLGKMILYF